MELVSNGLPLRIIGKDALFEGVGGQVVQAAIVVELKSFVAGESGSREFWVGHGAGGVLVPVTEYPVAFLSSVYIRPIRLSGDLRKEAATVQR